MGYKDRTKRNANKRTAKAAKARKASVNGGVKSSGFRRKKADARKETNE